MYPCEKTHRCTGSLLARVSIRKNAATSRWPGASTYPYWSLWSRDYDFDYDVYHENHVASIQFCPFCGKKFEEEKQ